MHWVIQDNIFTEDGLGELERVLCRMGLSHSYHKVVPFSGDLIPDVNPEGPVVCIGAYSMIRTARARGWNPGVWSNDNFDFSIWSERWKGFCLNDDALICTFATVPEAGNFFAYPNRQFFFMRPTMDSKAFAGKVFGWDEYVEWRHRVVALGEDDGSTLRASTPVLVCSPKVILREYRLWVVDGKVVTASQYKLGDRVVYDSNVDADAILFGTNLVTDMPPRRWVPDRAFVLDICLTDEGYKIVEINSLNAAGLYAANIGLLVDAIERMGYK